MKDIDVRAAVSGVGPSGRLKLADRRALLEGGPARVAALVRDLPPSLVHATEGPDTWTPRQVVGHLVHSERDNWIPRLRIAVLGGGGGRFPSFDQPAHLSLFAQTPIGVLVDEFARLRAESLRELDGFDLDDAKLARTALHPDLGEVTAAELLATWVAHDWAHLVQIARTVAKTQTESVGPWRQYLKVLRSQ